MDAGHALADGLIAVGGRAARFAAAIAGVEASDADRARAAQPEPIAVVVRAARGAPARRPLADAAGRAIGVDAALDAPVQRLIAPRVGWIGAVRVGHARDALAGHDVAMKSRDRAIGVAAASSAGRRVFERSFLRGVDRIVLVEAELAGARSEEPDDAPHPRMLQGASERIAAASSRAKPSGKERRYCRAAERARAPSRPRKAFIRSASALSSSGVAG